ncbi:MAG: endonuclease [Firmicutes bacterium HGW-Firmicutes-13]|nr:MAG: endonuclease [Firmicutes bacterium HGW-Firmicutes-13]
MEVFTILRLGCHLSIAKGLDKTALMAQEIKAATFQFFTRNPRGGAARNITDQEINNWIEVRSEKNLYPIVGHLPYAVNLAAPKKNIHTFAANVLSGDLERMDKIGAEYLVVHPGSHVGEGREKGINRIVKALEISLLKFNGKSKLLLETMAGQGTEIGSLIEIRDIIKLCGTPPGLGVCLDTCHLFSAGYDLNKKEGVEILLDDLQKYIGLEKVKVIHLNDSKYPLGSKKDRHELIGKGFIKKEGILNVLTQPAFKELPFILETPAKGYLEYGEEIKLIKSWLEEEQ